MRPVRIQAVDLDKMEQDQSGQTSHYTEETGQGEQICLKDKMIKYSIHVK